MPIYDRSSPINCDDRVEVIDHCDRIGHGRGRWWEEFDDAIRYATQ